MRLAISEVFCEIVSALGFVVGVLLPLLLWGKVFTTTELVDWLGTLNGDDGLWILVVLYVGGVFLDALGLPLDRVLDGWLGVHGQYPKLVSKKAFYENASSDLFAFRTNTWVYYYCFRNLWFFAILALFAWVPLVFVSNGLGWSVLLALILLVTILVLFLALKDHAALYQEITETFDQS